jgi:hypothetical protein
VHVVKQDPVNASVTLFDLSDCKIWDADNWDCTTSYSAFTQSYGMHQGVYTNVFYGGLGSVTYRTGTVKRGLLHRVLELR